MKQNKRNKDLLRFGLFLAALLVINLLIKDVVFRYDFTEDKRYSLSPITENILRELKEPVLVEVFFTGDFPTRFERVEEAIDAKLNEFAVYGDENFSFVYSDPTMVKDTAVAKRMHQMFAAFGIPKMPIYSKEGGTSRTTYTYPAALVHYKDRVFPIILIKGEVQTTEDERIQRTISELEYEFISAIKQVTTEQRKTVSFLIGQDEIDVRALTESLNALAGYYNVNLLRLDTVDQINTDVLVVAGPKAKFSEQEKYKIDHYLNRNGRAIMFLDQIKTKIIDTLGLIGIENDINLRDQLFAYGIRLNLDLIQDVYSSPKALNAGTKEYPKISFEEWQFNPLLYNYGKHPIVESLNNSQQAILSKDVSTIDTLPVAGVKKTPLVYTSQYSRKKGNPPVYPFSELNIKPEKGEYQLGSSPVCFLLEGQLPAFYADVPPPPNTKRLAFQPRAENAKLLVFSDGDILLPEKSPTTGQYFRLGYDMAMNRVHANLEFLLKAVGYMVEEQALEELRGKKTANRPLDKFKVEEEEQKWTYINMIVPPLLPILLFYLVPMLIRRVRKS